MNTSHVSINGLFLDYPYSGTWTYTRNLISSLALHEGMYRYTIFTRRAAAPLRGKGSIGYDRGISLFPRRRHSSQYLERLDKISWEVFSWPLVSRKADLLHSLYFAAPVLTSAPLIVTVHDTISLRAEYSRGQPARLYGRFMRDAARRASRLITVSQFSRREIAEQFDYPIERIEVTYEAPDPTLCRVVDRRELQTVRSRYGLPERYLLYLGGTERRKNIQTIVEAWAAGPPKGYCLVIVGRFPASPDPLFPDIPGMVASMALGDSVRLVPFVKAADLPAVYSLAKAFLFPSTYEGFGLPPLEAMACHVPVLAADSTSLPEILGDGAKLLKPTDVQSWRHTMARVVDDHAWAQDLSERGYRRSQTFTWSNTAAETVRIYDDVLAQ